MRESHPRCQQPHDLTVRFRFAQRGDGRVVDGDVVVSPCADDVEMLELRGRGQDDVGVSRRIGEKVLQHDREQVRAREPLPHARRVGLHDRRVGPPDHDSLDRWRQVRTRQRLAQPREVELARCAGHQVRPRRPALEEDGARLDEEPASGQAPVPAEDREGGEASHERFAVHRLLRPDAGADRGRPR